MRKNKRWQPSYYPMGVDPYCQQQQPMIMPAPRTIDEVEDIILFWEAKREEWEEKAKKKDEAKKKEEPKKPGQIKFTFLETLGLLVPLYFILVMASKMSGIALP